MIFGSFFLEIDLGCYQAQPSPILPKRQLELLLCSPPGENETCNIVVHNSSNTSNNSNKSIGNALIAHNIWTLHFDGSKT